MDTVDVYSSKAEKYRKYRWRYAPEAIRAIFERTGISQESTVADIGAGTGILTSEFVGKVRRIYAIEPNPEMRAIATEELGGFPSCQVIDGRAEATQLESGSIDLIAAAQAVHWFEPMATRREFSRILKPGGWLAFCRNYGANRQLENALQNVYPAETDTEVLMLGKRKPKHFYFGGEDYLKVEFPFRSFLNWDAFLGSLTTASFAPDEGGDLYGQFERQARRVFECFNVDGMLEICGMTELYLGQMARG